MIKVNDKLEEKSYKFPKTSSKNTPFYNLVLKSETIIKHKFEGLTDESDNPKYYEFNLSFENVEDGEYKYIIEGYVFEYGVIRIGELKNENKQYKEKNTIIQYE